MDREARPTVVVADAHEHYRRGMLRALAVHPGLELVGVAEDGHTALSLINATRADLAVLDVRLPGIDGFTIAERISSHPSVLTRCVLLTAVPDRAQTLRSLSVGAGRPG